ncbi:MAG: deoxyguanosinetriphosphate triphosphohydrolase [Waterburya sp.]
MSKPKPMQWEKLLTRERLGKNESEEKKAVTRTCFQQDYDRLVFSSPFRRLKDKTQVFPLSKHDYVRTRLIHSLEVSCVGRSLGSLVGKKIIERHERSLVTEKQKKDLEPFNASDFGDIVSAACLAHDLGNPPFGHAGEGAIATAFDSWDKNNKDDLTEKQRKDFGKFEGNAQGFRLLTRLEMSPKPGGMQLTCPTLAAFTKYPRESYIPEDQLKIYKGRKSIDKYGFFQSEKDLFSQVAETVGLIRHDKDIALWARHPLAFLVEAADDICYHIIDLEDGYRMGYVSYAETKDLLNQIAQLSNPNEDIHSDGEKIKRLRAKAINKLILEITALFVDKEDDLLAGTFDADLISLSSYRNCLQNIKDKTREKVFRNPEIVKIEIAGNQVINNLFEKLANGLLQNNQKKANFEYILPVKYRPIEGDSLYSNLMRITDYISGMTDTYATELFQQLQGISLK